MMGSSPLPGAGTGGPAYDDTALVERIAGVEQVLGTKSNDIEIQQQFTVQNDKVDQAIGTANGAANVAGAAKASADASANTLSQRKTGLTEFFVGPAPAAYTTISAACDAIRTFTADLNFIPTVLIAAGRYIENPNFRGLPKGTRFKTVGNDYEFQTYAASVLSSDTTTRAQTVNYTIPTAEWNKLTVGDVINVRKLVALTTPYQANASGACQVLAKPAANVVTVIFRAYGNAVVPLQVETISRFSVQLRLTAAIQLGNGDDIEIQNFGVTQDIAPNAAGTITLLNMTDGARLYLPINVANTGKIPAIGLCNALAGLVAIKGAQVSGGFMSSGNHSGPSVVIESEARVLLFGAYVTNSAIAFRMVGGKLRLVSNSPSAYRLDTIIAGAQYESVLGYSRTETEIRNGTIVAQSTGNGVVGFAIDGTFIDIKSSDWTGQIIPPANSIANNNSIVVTS